MPTKNRNSIDIPGARLPVVGAGWVSLFVLIGLTVLTCLAVGYSGIVSASPSYIQAGTPTPGAQTGDAPSPVSSPRGGVPAAIPSGLPSPRPTGQAQVVGATDTATGNAPGTTNTPAPSGEFPWLIVGLVTLVVLAGLVFAAMRQRRTATAIEADAGQTRSRADLRNISTPATGATTTSVTQTATGATAAPGMVKCPNCGTNNAATEKYCRECGQDLRSAIAQSTAQAAQAASQVPVMPPPPAEAVAADTPYLESLDRVDEQLEFVLARQRVLIGTAPGSDIVIDAAFKGWQTVSPQHAELRREHDGGFEIVDRASENGTFVNEMRTGENILSDGDLVRLGEVRFVFRVPKGGG